MRIALATLVFGICLGGAAHAMLPPEVYRRARVEAPLHLQIAVESVEVQSGACLVHGRVAQVFKGGARVGKAVRARLACMTPDVEPMPGPTMWQDPNAVAAAAAIEGFFEKDGAMLRPALDQVSIVPAPRDRPWCGTQSLQCDLD